LKNSTRVFVLKGHDFSRAAQRLKMNGGFSRCGKVLFSLISDLDFFQQAVQSCRKHQQQSRASAPA
jgi:hypothetical protein